MWIVIATYEIPGVILHDLLRCTIDVIDPYNGPLATGAVDRELYYNEEGKREQVVTSRQGDINLADLPHFPRIPKESVILVAPVIGEVDTHLFPILSKYGQLVVTPQGYFREIGTGGVVRRKPWRDIQSLSHARMTILSDEDLTFDETGINLEMLDEIRKLCPVVVLTQGEEGSTIFEGDTGQVLHTGIFPLGQGEVRDLTGAGDTYAAAFIAQYERTKDLKEASVFAALYAALKIKSLGGEGMGLTTIPTLAQVEGFVQTEKERYQRFLQENGLRQLHLNPERNHSAKERV